MLAARASEHIERWRPVVKANLLAARQTMSDWLDTLREADLLDVESIGQSATLFPRVSAQAAPLEFVERLIEEHHVLVAPGEFFLPTTGRAIRIGYGGDPDDLAEGLARLAAGLRAIS